jgi:hypothetical protein
MSGPGTGALAGRYKLTLAELADDLRLRGMLVAAAGDVHDGIDFHIARVLLRAIVAAMNTENAESFAEVLGSMAAHKFHTRQWERCVDDWVGLLFLDSL